MNMTGTPTLALAHISNIRPTSPAALGFTLTETLIVLGISALFVNLSMANGIDMYERGLARTDRELLAAAVREARAQAMSGVCEGVDCDENGLDVPNPHGVHVAENGITIFEGSSYAARETSADEFIPFSASETPGGVSDVVFAELSGDTLASSTTILLNSADHHSETVTVSSEGVIQVSTI